jgi:hypothetical protein
MVGGWRIYAEYAYPPRALRGEVEAATYGAGVLETKNLACQARQAGDRAETGKHLVNCLWNEGWRLPVGRRALAGLAVYPHRLLV